MLAALVHLWASLLTYLMSSLTLGIFWVGQQTQLRNLARSNRSLAWIDLAFPLMVALMPFATSLPARLALLVYWLNLLLLGVMLFASWRYASRMGPIRKDVTPAGHAAIYRRTVGYQALYAGAVVLCVINTHLSIAIIVLLQVNSATARFGPLHRL